MCINIILYRYYIIPRHIHFPKATWLALNFKIGGLLQLGGSGIDIPSLVSTYNNRILRIPFCHSLVFFAVEELFSFSVGLIALYLESYQVRFAATNLKIYAIGSR